MKRWQQAVLAVLALIVFAGLWLLDAYTVANAHRLWRVLLLLFTLLIVPAPIAAAGYAAYRDRKRWFRYGTAGLLAAFAYPFLNLVLFFAGLSQVEAYRFVPDLAPFLIGAPPEAVPTASGTTHLFIVPTALRTLPLFALPLAHILATDGADRRRLLLIATLPSLTALFWLVTLVATLSGVCVPVCGLPR